MVFSKNLKRASKVARALVRHGLGWVVQHYGLVAWLPFYRRAYVRRGAREDLPVKLRRTMEELGGAFVKLGQMLALREDLIPREYCDEFRKLLDAVPPVPVREVRKVISEELGRPFGEVFVEFDPLPLGSASIAQVHRAKLLSGKTVVVKVQRPGIREVLEADISLLYAIARRLQHRLEGVADPLKIVEEFERYTRQELDFVHEARNIDAFAHGFKGRESVRIPRVHWSVTTKRVLTMEYIDGVKLSAAKLRSPHRVAKELVDVMVFQVFELGLFHADLHPGNILVLKNERLAFLDFGIVGRLTPQLRSKGVELWLGMTGADLDVLVRTLEDIGFPDEAINIEKFRRDVYETLRKWGEEANRRPSTVFRALFETAIRYHIHLPIDMVLLAKALLTVEGTCATIDPSFDFYEYARKKSDEFMTSRSGARKRAQEFVGKGRDLAKVLYQIPGETLHMLDHLKHGRVLIDLDDTDIKHLGLDINLSSNRLSYALLVSALAVTGALTIDVGPGAFGFSFLSLGFFTLAFFFVWPLVISIMHEGHPRYDPH